ncbi:MAG: carboxypeptidase-like regulatory domain-containing protein [Pyrinomonadaceae bacterium]
MKRFLFAAMFASLVVFMSAGMALGQNTAGVRGIITDSTGAVIGGVEVKLTDTKTGTEIRKPVRLSSKTTLGLWPHLDR